MRRHGDYKLRLGGKPPGLRLRWRRWRKHHEIRREVNELVKGIRKDDVFSNPFGKCWTVYRIQPPKFMDYALVTAQDSTGEFTSWTSLAWVLEMQPVYMHEEVE
jgi:hypothetical protein